jgi:hypothetical protein
VSKQKSSSGGLGFVGALTIVFIVLKLLGKISWSWVWVLSPIWILGILVIALLVFYGILLFTIWRKL